MRTILYHRKMDSGETAHNVWKIKNTRDTAYQCIISIQKTAPKGKRKTLRQKDRIPDDTLESIAPKKPNLSGPRTERMNIFCSCAFIGAPGGRTF